MATPRRWRPRIPGPAAGDRRRRRRHCCTQSIAVCRPHGLLAARSRRRQRRRAIGAPAAEFVEGLARDRDPAGAAGLRRYRCRRHFFHWPGRASAQHSDSELNDTRASVDLEHPGRARGSRAAPPSSVFRGERRTCATDTCSVFEVLADQVSAGGADEARRGSTMAFRCARAGSRRTLARFPALVASLLAAVRPLGLSEAERSAEAEPLRGGAADRGLRVRATARPRRTRTSIRIRLTVLARAVRGVGDTDCDSKNYFVSASETAADSELQRHETSTTGEPRAAGLASGRAPRRRSDDSKNGGGGPIAPYQRPLSTAARDETRCAATYPSRGLTRIEDGPQR